MLLDTQKSEFVGRQALWQLSPGSAEIAALDRTRSHFELADDVIRNLGLDGEQVLYRPVPAIRPNVGASLRIDKLRRRADALSIALDRALEHIAYVQIAPNMPHIG